VRKIWQSFGCKTRKKALAKHPVKNIVLAEIMMQLETFENYAEKEQQSEVAQRFRQMKDTIKNAVPGQDDLLNYESGDEVFRSIKAYLKNF